MPDSFKQAIEVIRLAVVGFFDHVEQPEKVVLDLQFFHLGELATVSLLPIRNVGFQRSGIRLTSAGEELVRYCKHRQVLESECLGRIKQPKSASLMGIIRVGGYSTVTRSLILPALRPLLAENPEVRIEVVTREMRELPTLLRSGETDFVFLDHALEKEGAEAHLLGYEENVLIEPKTAHARADVFLDHDLEDDRTLRFFEAQGRKQKKPNRAFLDEIYCILDAVELGMGRAVVPQHLLRAERRVQTAPGLKPLRLPVYLNYYRQPFYTRLQKAVIERLTQEVKSRLAGK